MLAEIINVHYSENWPKRTPIGPKQGVRYRRCPFLRGCPKNVSKIKRNTKAKQSMEAETFYLPLT